jgi:hypothetical protein
MSDTEQEQRKAEELAKQRVRERERAEREARRWKFDGTVNLGHVLTAAVMLIGGLGVWTQGREVMIRQDSRLALVETTMAEVKSNLSKISESQQLAIRTQDKLAATLDAISRKP